MKRPEHWNFGQHAELSPVLFANTKSNTFANIMGLEDKTEVWRLGTDPLKKREKEMDRWIETQGQSGDWQQN